MDYFTRKDGQLYCEKIPIAQLADKYGTPLYIYSLKTFTRHLDVVSSAFGELPHDIFYSVKANSNISLLRIVGELGYGCDVVSFGEYLIARKAGIKKIIFSGVGKTDYEIAESMKGGLLFFGAESENELLAIEKIARKLGKKAPISIRINPDVDPKTHHHIATGLREEKFGIPAEQAVSIYRRMAKSRYLKPVGVSMHIGSQVITVKPYIEAVEKMAELFGRLSEQKILLRYLDLGGGWAAPFERDHKVPMPSDYVKAILPSIAGLKASIFVEPGRSIVGNAGVLVSRVIYVKKARGKQFAIVDSGMNDFIRPALYDGHHRIEPVNLKTRTKNIYDVVGPICENADTFARGIQLPKVGENDLLCLFTAGAYGYSMSSNYNSRLKAAEILVDGDKDYLIRERETYKDLWRKQRFIKINHLSPLIK
jgi:diaminopimelate decarboxylase